MNRRRRGPIGLLAAVCGLIACAAFGAPAAVGATYSSRVSVSASPASQPLPSNFLGFAFEYNTIPRWTAHGAQPINPPLVALIHNLDPLGHALIRVGGESTDRSWWPVPGMTKPYGETYNLTPGWAATAKALAVATTAQYMLGINLEANRQRVSQYEADQLVAGIGRTHIAELQIGNEPDLYSQIPWYKLVGGRRLPWFTRTGTSIFSRKSTYSPTQFVQEYARTVKVLPPVPLAGPETGRGPWLTAFKQFVTPGSQVRMLTSHAYGLNQCVTNPTSPVFPTIPNMVSLTASRSMLPGIPPWVTFAHSVGATYRIDEMGSVTCNGHAGVSDTMSSALWAMDALFSIAQEDIDGVNLHSYPNSANGLFDFSRDSNGTWDATVHPLYYGVLMFARAAPPGSRLLGLTPRAQYRLRAWATIGTDAKVRVLLINDSLGSTAQVSLQAPAGYGASPAALQRLQAPSAGAKTGVTIGGRSFGTSTATGVLAAPVQRTVAPGSGGYSVSLPPASAALLTLTHS